MKERLDNLIFKKGLSESRERAKSLIMSGIVYIDDIKMDKPGIKVDEDANVNIRGKRLPYVSRGGLKLEKAMAEFEITLDGKIAMDVGSSTGGFTDCMLQNGAIKVFAIDVGYGQLAWKLRSDERVVSMERTNIRYVDKDMIKDDIDFSSIDVSFISLKKVLPVVKMLLGEEGQIVALIKPQFEAGRENIGKKGVVRDSNVHKGVIKDIVDFVNDELKLCAVGLTFSPVKGPEGNIEYLLYIKKSESTCLSNITTDIIDLLVDRSHSELVN